MIELRTLFILINNSWIAYHFIYLKAEKGTPFARGELEVYPLFVAWNRLLYFYWLIRELATTTVTATATATKISLKKWSRAAWILIALILSPLMRQMLAIFCQELTSERLYRLYRSSRKEKKVVVVCSRPPQKVKKLGIFTFVVVQWRQRNARAELVLPI